MNNFNSEELYEEYLKIRQLRFLVDHTADQLMTKKLSKNSIDELLEETRKKVLDLFPDEKETYKLIYDSRFKRLIEDFQ